MIANCLSPEITQTEANNGQPCSSKGQKEKGNPLSHRDLSSTSGPDTSEEPEVLHHASSRLQ